MHTSATVLFPPVTVGRRRSNLQHSLWLLVFDLPGSGASARLQDPTRSPGDHRLLRHSAHLPVAGLRVHRPGLRRAAVGIALRDQRLSGRRSSRRAQVGVDARCASRALRLCLSCFLSLVRVCRLRCVPMRVCLAQAIRRMRHCACAYRLPAFIISVRRRSRAARALLNRARHCTACGGDVQSFPLVCALCACPGVIAREHVDERPHRLAGVA